MPKLATNETRAARGEAAFQAYRKAMGSGVDLNITAEWLTDIVTDLLHWAVRNGETGIVMEFDAILQGAHGHFLAEAEEEGVRDAV